MSPASTPSEVLSFAEVAKRLRKEAGLTQAQAAAAASVSRSYIGQVESGTTRCRLDFTQRLDRAIHANGQLVTAWEDLLESIKTTKYPRYFVSFPKAEKAAVLLRCYEERLVYGLFQTQDYARALLPDEESFMSRMERQKVLLRENPPAISVVMDESVLYRELGGPSVMHAQLEHLLGLSERPNITLQILPIIYVRNVWGTFAIATGKDNSQVVYTDKAYGGETSMNEDDIAFVNETFTRLQAEALNARDTRAFIRKVIQERWT
ncbi:helix-turn-helix domain-containing protein [Actinomadura parmotrematis]|uniref:Helix-turn-helix domain-containing protein n=1 Tax=Actinomadura parmotrematis TaxID=2864039 RepID=A0ABS7FW11_9ACTN|nr:helix-turn-helix transcriptional regulator [Actinomadura parmotrematis]MBW8483762.1 helix-turn-helix domain-containing protein [Actinomadura parmotrematis]